MTDALQIASPAAPFPASPVASTVKTDPTGAVSETFAGLLQQASATLVTSTPSAGQKAAASQTILRVHLSDANPLVTDQTTGSLSLPDRPEMSGPAAGSVVVASPDHMDASTALLHPASGSTSAALPNEIDAAGENASSTQAVPMAQTANDRSSTAQKELGAPQGGEALQSQKNATAAVGEKAVPAAETSAMAKTNAAPQACKKLVDDARPGSAERNVSNDDVAVASDEAAQPVAAPLAGTGKVTICKPVSNPTLPNTDADNTADSAVSSSTKQTIVPGEAIPTLDRTVAQPTATRGRAGTAAKEVAGSTQRGFAKAASADVSATPATEQAASPVLVAPSTAVAVSVATSAPPQASSQGTQTNPTETSAPVAVAGPANVAGARSFAPSPSKATAAKPSADTPSGIAATATPVEAVQGTVPLTGHTEAVGRSGEALAGTSATFATGHPAPSFTPSASVSHASSAAGAVNSTATSASSGGVDSLNDASLTQGVRRDGALEVGYHDTTLGWLSVRASLDRSGDIQAALATHNPAAAGTVSNMLPALNRFLQEQSVSVQSVTSSSHMAATVSRDATAQAGSAGTASFAQSQQQQQPGAQPNADRQQRESAASRTSNWSRPDQPRSGSADVSANAVAPTSIGQHTTVSVRI